ncbi:MAG: sugar phosphate isomerase/epimerase family protein [Christensenellales bacterium]|jgi:sugar phosphate isomerase/epimerase
MNIAFTTLGCPDWTFLEVLDNAKTMGYQGIEIRGIEGEMRAENMGPLKPGKQQDTLRQLKVRNLTVPCYGSSIRFDDATQKEAMLEEGRCAIDVCARMGISYIRVFGDRIDDPRNEDRIISQVAEGISALCAYAEGTDVGILLEVHGDFNIVERILKTAEQIKSPKFGVLWDVQHSDKIYGDNFLPFYEPLKHLIRHVHVKDHHRADGAFKLCSVGEGDVPLKQIINRLKADAFDGYFALEWEKKWHPELADANTEFPSFVDFMRSV